MYRLRAQSANPLRRLFVLFGTFALAALVLAACSSTNQAVSTTPTGGTTSSSVSMTFDPNPPVANKPATLTIHMTDGGGKGVTGASVAVSAHHTEMSHGTVDASANETEAGTYVAKITPTMAGPWQMSVTAQINGATKKANFDVAVK